MPLPVFCLAVIGFVGLGIVFLMSLIGLFVGENKDNPPRIISLLVSGLSFVALVTIGATVNESYSAWAKDNVSDIASRNDKVHDPNWSVNKDCSAITYTPTPESEKQMKVASKGNVTTVNVGKNDKLPEKVVAVQNKEFCNYKSPSTFTNVKNFLSYTLQDKASSDN